MRITPKKDYKWSIDFKAVDFKEGESADVEDSIAKEMIDKGYAENNDNTSKTKESLVEENKAIESTEENKDDDYRSKKKRGKSKK